MKKNLIPQMHKPTPNRKNKIQQINYTEDNMSRKTAREAAFKAIFEIPFHSCETPGEIIDFCISNQNEELTSESDKSYFKDVTSLCFENLDQIDEKISSHLKDWTLERISKINLSILRLAFCEITYMEDIPYQVSINEAVEVAKKFGDDDSPSFINAVLASAV